MRSNYNLTWQPAKKLSSETAREKHPETHRLGMLKSVRTEDEAWEERSWRTWAGGWNSDFLAIDQEPKGPIAQLVRATDS